MTKISSQWLASNEAKIDELKELLEKEKQNTNDYIEKWKRALADYENLKKRTDLDIVSKVTTEINKIMLNFLIVYEDLIRAKKMLVDDQKNIEGLDGIIKNMDSIFHEHNIKAIDSVGQIFNPNLHEAVSIVEDENLEDDTIMVVLCSEKFNKNEYIWDIEEIINGIK